ncbi:19667_t:CDS:2, partial [Racocetra fulgida]
GTGKSTLACLIVEYLNYKNKKVQLIDTDPIQTSQTWANNCQEEEGLEQLKKIIQEEGQGKITNPLTNRPALYGTLLNGKKIKNSLTSQHLAGNYEYPNLSAFIRAAFGSYQKGMPLTYQRQPNNPKKEICVRLGGELLTFYQRLAPSSKNLILERALGSYYQKLS